MLTINQDGSLAPDTDSIKRFLKRHSGKWRIVSTIPRLLVLQKMETGVKGAPRALLNGSIERPGWLIEMINFISNSRLSGDLVTVSEDNVQRELIFEKGALRIAFSTARADLLGEFILSEGILNKAQLDEALNAQTSDKRLGQILVEKGLLSGPDVYSILQRKTQRIFYDTIAVGGGIYYFISDFGHLKLPASMFMDTQALLMEGVKRIDDLEQYNQIIPKRTSRLAAAPGPLDGYSESERRYIECVDGRRTVADIDMILRLGVDEILSITHRMSGKGLIKTISAQEMEAQTLQSVVNSFNQALDMIYHSLETASVALEVARLSQDFLEGESHNNKTLAKIKLDKDGRLSLENIRTIYRESTERDRVKLVVMVLTQYISFVLFNVIERFPRETQEQLSARVNETLSDIFASNL